MAIAKITADEADRAYEAWGANCGPGAIAAIMGMRLDDVRSHIPGFEVKRYTSPTMMYAALKSIGRPWRKVGKCWPNFGLARIQWEGPWTEPGVPVTCRSWIASAARMPSHAPATAAMAARPNPTTTDWREHERGRRKIYSPDVGNGARCAPHGAGHRDQVGIDRAVEVVDGENRRAANYR